MSRSFDIAVRQAAITGKPPRIAPLPPEDWGPEVYAVMNGILAAVNLPLKPATEPMDDHAATMMKSPALFKAHMGLALCLFGGELSVRDRELAVLRIGWLCGAPFEWGEHVKMSKRMAKVTDEEVLWARQGSSAAGWNDHERAILRAVEELISDAMISEETWNTLALTLNEKQLLELPILVGQYQGVAYLQNSIRLRLIPGNAGLNAV